MTDYKIYTNLECLYEIPAIIQENVIACSSDLDSILESWAEYMSDDTIQRYEYTKKNNGKKYQHRFGYELEFLIPQHTKKDEAGRIAHYFMEELLRSIKKVSWIAEFKTKGDGFYIVITLVLSKKYNKEVEIKTFYESDVYRNKITGGFINKDHDNAILVRKKGDIKKITSSSWSQKIRIFEMSRKEFTENFLPMIYGYIKQAIYKVKKIREKTYLKTIKHRVLTNKKRSSYYNSNIRYYNSFVTSANILIEYWENAIYSPTNYYQDDDLVREWISFKNKFKIYLKNKRFNLKSNSSSKTFNLSINPWINTLTFRDNINSLQELFDANLEKFINNNIIIEKY